LDFQAIDKRHAMKIPKDKVAQAKSRYSIEYFDKLIVRTITHENEISNLTNKV